MPISHVSVKYLSAEQVASVIEAAGGLRNKALLAAVYQCGLRRGEVELLERDSFSRNRGHGVMKVTRIKKDGFYVQEIPLWRRTTTLLAEYIDSRTDHMDPLFLSHKLVAMTGQAVYYVFRNAAIRAGLPEDLLHPHVLRHSIAVHLMNMGVDLADVQEHLGHDSIDSTLVYARVLNPRKRRNALLSEVSHHFAKF